MSTYPLSDLKPDPDELEQGIPQMELEASLSGIENSGSATLTREPNYDYQVLLTLLYSCYVELAQCFLTFLKQASNIGTTLETLSIKLIL